MSRSSPSWSANLDEAVLLLNAWRRLCAFISLAEDEAGGSDVRALVQEMIAPALFELGELCDRLAPEQLKAAHGAPSAWSPDFRDPRWRRHDPVT